MCDAVLASTIVVEVSTRASITPASDVSTARLTSGSVNQSDSRRTECTRLARASERRQHRRRDAAEPCRKSQSQTAQPTAPTHDWSPVHEAPGLCSQTWIEVHTGIVSGRTGAAGEPTSTCKANAEDGQRPVEPTGRAICLRPFWLSAVGLGQANSASTFLQACSSRRRSGPAPRRQLPTADPAAHVAPRQATTGRRRGHGSDPGLPRNPIHTTRPRGPGRRAKGPGSELLLTRLIDKDDRHCFRGGVRARIQSRQFDPTSPPLRVAGDRC